MAETPEKDKIIYRFGRFEIDAREKLLSSGGEIVPLTPKIFEMLLLLVRNNKRMLSKDEIMETVWANSFVEETNLTSNISRLRKILHQSGEKYIETYPKRGYRFRAEVEQIKADTEIILTRRVTTRVRQVVEEFDENNNLPEYAAALETLPNNLTLPLTPIVGREKEISEIENLLRNNNLVTLTGIGGTGKTRLAQEIACRLLSDVPDGVFFIALAAVAKSELVPSEIADTLGVKESSGKNLTVAIKGFLREKNILLVADNFEQIISAAPILAQLLSTAPGLKILVTSRALLHLKAEREFIVPPLKIPETNSVFNNLAENESVKLFAERARAIKQNFPLTEENAEIVAEICRRLEGLPLAIELAAARIKILSPPQILERLENRLKLLTGGAKDLPTRQQTMRGAIEWSFELLEDNERVLFQRLAVFAGNFTIEAAESVCVNSELLIAADESSEDDRSADIDILNGICALVENSLLVQTEAANGESRFRLLEVVREFAGEILEKSGKIEHLKKNHTAFYLALAQKAEPEIFGETGEKWLARLEESLDNLRAALDWAIVNDPVRAVNLAASLRTFWILQNHLSEGRKWLERVINCHENAASPEVRFKLFSGLGHTAGYQGDLETARKAHEKGLAESRSANNLRQIAISIRGLGFVAKWQNDIAAAREFYNEALAVSRDLEDLSGIAASLTSLGDLARMENDDASARPFYEEAFEICRQTANKQGIVGSLNNLAAVSFGEGDYPQALDYYQEAMNEVLKLGEKISLSYSLDGYAALAVKHGDFERAARLAGVAEYLRESLGFETEPAERHFRQAYLEELNSVFEKTDFSEAYQKGRQMKIEEAVEVARKQAL